MELTASLKETAAHDINPEAVSAEIIGLENALSYLPEAAPSSVQVVAEIQQRKKLPSDAKPI